MSEPPSAATAGPNPVAVLALLDTVAAMVACPDNRFMHSGWVDGADALAEIDALRARVRKGEIPSAAIAVLMLPTGPLQELALDSGWGDGFIALATIADAVLKA